MRAPMRLAHWHAITLALSINCFLCSNLVAENVRLVSGGEHFQRSNKMDELFKEINLHSDDQPQMKHNSILISAEDFEPNGGTSSSSSSSFSLSSNSFDEPEMLKNNHNQATTNNIDGRQSVVMLQNSRHYNQQQQHHKQNFGAYFAPNSHYSHLSHHSQLGLGQLKHHQKPHFNHYQHQNQHVSASLAQLHALVNKNNNNNKQHLFNSDHNALSGQQQQSQATSSYQQQHHNLSSLHSLLTKEQAAKLFLHSPIDISGNSIEIDAPTSGSKLQRPSSGQAASGAPLLPSELLGPELCGRQQAGPMRSARIVGGNSTYEGEFPWAVSIQRHGNHHCGGVIIARRWILTAAHCVRSQFVANLMVRTGGHTLQQRSSVSGAPLGSMGGTNNNQPGGGGSSRDHAVDQIIMHDDFNRFDNLQPSSSFSLSSSSSPTNVLTNSLLLAPGNMMKSSANTANNADIALLRLRNQIQLNEFAWPVCFPSREAGNFSGHDAVVIGWGKLSEKSEEFSNELQKVKLTIIDNKVCQNWFRQAGREMPIDERIICAGFKQGGKDACHGDSGGPLLSRMASGQYAVVGVVSTGIGCARPLLPGLYSRVSSYIGWIEAQIAASTATTTTTTISTTMLAI